MIAGGVIVVGTIVEDFLTGGLGILDDPPTLALGGGLVAGGWALLAYANSSSLPSAPVPARVAMKVALTATATGVPEP